MHVPLPDREGAVEADRDGRGRGHVVAVGWHMLLRSGQRWGLSLPRRGGRRRRRQRRRRVSGRVESLLLEKRLLFGLPRRLFAAPLFAPGGVLLRLEIFVVDLLHLARLPPDKQSIPPLRLRQWRRQRAGRRR